VSPADGDRLELTLEGFAEAWRLLAFAYDVAAETEGMAEVDTDAVRHGAIAAGAGLFKGQHGRWPTASEIRLLIIGPEEES
jgi:hypothetical protein